MIVEKGRKFTEDEEGCRFWIYTLVEDLESEGLIEEGSTAQAYQSLSHYWVNLSGYEPRLRMEEGAFY